MKNERKQEGEGIGETGRDKMIKSGMFSRYVKEGKKVTKVYLNIPFLTLSLCYKLRKSYCDPKSCYGELKEVKIRARLLQYV